MTSEVTPTPDTEDVWLQLNEMLKMLKNDIHEYFIRWYFLLATVYIKVDSDVFVYFNCRLHNVISL